MVDLGPFSVQQFLYFMQFWESLVKLYVGTPPPEGLTHPPTGNSGSATMYH